MSQHLLHCDSLLVGMVSLPKLPCHCESMVSTGNRDCQYHWGLSMVVAWSGVGWVAVLANAVAMVVNVSIVSNPGCGFQTQAVGGTCFTTSYIL